MDSTIEKHLKQVKDMYNQKLIDSDEYSKLKNQILNFENQDGSSFQDDLKEVKPQLSNDEQSTLKNNDFNQYQKDYSSTNSQNYNNIESKVENQRKDYEKKPWQIDALGIALGFIFFGIIPGVLAIIGSLEYEKGYNVKTYVTTYNVFALIMVSIMIISIAFFVFSAFFVVTRYG